MSNRGQRLLAPSIRKFVYDGMEEMALQKSVVVREIFVEDNLKLQLSHHSQQSTVFSTSNGLSVLTISPNWSRGIRKYFKDETLYDYISWFFHFVEQYIARSKYVEIMGAIALVYGKKSEFYSGSLAKYIIGSGHYTIEDVYQNYSIPKENKVTSSKQRRYYSLYNLLNGLDPFIHRMLFNYLRSLELFEHDFMEETITSLDKTVNVIEQYIKSRLSISSVSMREELCKTLGLNANETAELIRLYELRCYFGGHPALSKWWDFSEIYTYEEIEEYIFLVKEVVIKAVMLENNNRRIEKNPDNWHNWFKENWSLLWQSVWFEGLLNNKL